MDGRPRPKRPSRVSKTSYDALPLSEDDEDITYRVEGEQNCCTRCSQRLFPAGGWSEFQKMFTITWPIVVTQICQMIIGPISLIFCGHLGDPIKLDGAAMAVSMINATCISVGQGLGTACDTFFSQTYGSKNRKQVGNWLQKAIIIFALALLGCFTLHLNLELILRLLGQHPEVARLAGNYLLIFMPGAVGFFMYIVIAKFIQNQNIVLPNVIIGLIANAVNAILHYIFLYQLDMGTDGSAIAQAVSYVLMFILTLLYILISKSYEDVWDGWSTECLQQWGKFCRLAIPGMLMVCLEWWGFEIGVFLTGLLGTTELGAQSILLQIDSIWFQIPLGIQIACAIRVGQYLGMGTKLGAVTSANLAIFVVFCASIVLASIFLIFRYQLPRLFTNVLDIAKLTGDLLPIVTLYMFFDGIATACKGVLYGTGRQTMGAVILFVSYYCIALPIGIPLMFLTYLRSAAYWWALAINLILQATVLFTLVMKTDWDRQVQKAQERAGMMGEVIEAEENGVIGYSERDSLLPDRQRRPSRKLSRQRLISASLTQAEIKSILEVEPKLAVREVLLRRVLVVLIMLAIFGVGIAVRILVVIPPPDSQMTTPYPTNVTDWTTPVDLLTNVTNVISTDGTRDGTTVPI